MDFIASPEYDRRDESALITHNIFFNIKQHWFDSAAFEYGDLFKNKKNPMEF